MFGFILNMFIMDRMTADQVSACVAKGYITPDEYQQITGEVYAT